MSVKSAMKKQTADKEKASSPMLLRHTTIGKSPPQSPKLAATFKAEFSPTPGDNIFEKAPCVSFITDDTDTNKLETVTEVNERRKWRRAALAVAIASLMASLLLCAASFFGAATMGSSAVLVSALDALFSVFSAAMMIWRFSDDRNGSIGSKREKYGSIVLGVIFIVNGVITIVVSTFHLIDQQRPTDSNITWPALLCFSFVYLVLAILKYWIYRQNKSCVLFTLVLDDASTSAIMFGVFISTLLLDQIPNLWYLDHVVAIAFELVLIATGLKIFVDIFVYNERAFY